MVSQKWDPNSPVVKAFVEEPFRFDFFRAVALLEHLCPDRAPVGRFASPSNEIVRFRAHQTLSFPPSAIAGLRQDEKTNGPIEMTVAFMGLTGPLGVLPQHYTELLIEESRAPRSALRDFFDLFNHRFISLFYRAWAKHHVYLGVQQSQAQGLDQDRFAQWLGALIGFSDSEPGPTQLPLQGRSLLYYTGLLAQQPRSAWGLKHLLQHYFQARIEILEFIGEWLTVSPSDYTHLSSTEHNNRLGQTTALGTKAWDQQARIHIRVGPLRFEQFFQFLPKQEGETPGKLFERMVYVARLFVGPGLDFTIRPTLQADEVPPCRLVQKKGYVPRLGWSTWLWSQPRTQDGDEVWFDGHLAGQTV